MSLILRGESRMSDLPHNRIDDVRIARLRPVLPPAILIEQLPLGPDAETFVYSSRREVSAILHGTDDRLLVVVGPCSIHDDDAALEYATRLAGSGAGSPTSSLLVMRVYFEKPRTTVGWKGLINDPHLDGSFRINEGLRLARGLLLDLDELGVPAGTEFLDTDHAAVHRGPDRLGRHRRAHHREPGAPRARVRAVVPGGLQERHGRQREDRRGRGHRRRPPHHFLSVTKQGLSAIVETRGNATATSSCAAATVAPTTTPRRWPPPAPGFANRASAPG